tara:strand:- start:2751 stop:3305 length:555 start_codon:yes stop_codon:yes gene_type:complete
MSDYNFYGVNIPVALNTGVCTLTDPETIAAANPLGNSGDLVYMKISDTQGVVVVVQETVTRGKFDKDIYNNVPSSFTPSLAYYFDINSDLLSDSVSSFRLQADATISRYSESYRPYNSSFKYSLIVDSRKRLLFGDAKELISTTWVLFKDGCNEVAYLVSFDEDTFVALNNKFKSTLEFNIATR